MSFGSGGFGGFGSNSNNNTQSTFGGFGSNNNNANNSGGKHTLLFSACSARPRETIDTSRRSMSAAPCTSNMSNLPSASSGFGSSTNTGGSIFGGANNNNTGGGLFGSNNNNANTTSPFGGGGMSKFCASLSRHPSDFVRPSWICAPRSMFLLRVLYFQAIRRA
jgi:nuclear pore complex protein Nup98-Nup96